MAQARAAGSTSPSTPSTFKVCGIDGSSFETPPINAIDGKLYQELYQIIAKRVELKPWTKLVLTSGGKVIDSTTAGWHVGPEISYVLQQVGAAEASLKFLQALAGDTLPMADAMDAAMDALESLEFGFSFKTSLTNVSLPSSLRSLNLGFRFDESLNGLALPQTLQTLTFGHQFNQSLTGVTWPSSLRKLTFGQSFNQSLVGAFPVPFPSLESLTLGSNFNQSLEAVSLPENIRNLKFGDRFNQSLEGISLPGSMEHLEFGRGFNQSLEGVTLPSL